MFIEETDLAKALHLELIAEIKRNDTELIPYVINAAIAEMIPYLSENYDTEVIFAATGTERDGLLALFAVDIAVYNLIELAQPGIDTEDRRARYKRAIDWLKQVRDQQIRPFLPKAENAPAADLITYGSVTKRETRY